MSVDDFMTEDDTLIHPLDALNAYALAGSFVEARLARLKADKKAELEEVQAAEGLSRVLFYGICAAMSELDDAVTVTTTESDPARMLS